MHRGFIVLIILILSSLACGFIGTVTPAPSPTSLPTEAASASQLPTDTPSVENSRTDTPSASSAVTHTPIVNVTSSPTQEEPTKTPYPTSVLDKALTNEINLIQTQVVEERRLQPKYPVGVVLLSPEELRNNVVNDFLADYTDEKASDDVLERSIIGLLPPGFDLRGLNTDLLSEGIAGYYDNDTKEMFVVQGQGFQGYERLTYSHEYTHVLQDQNFDIPNGLNYNQDACEVDSERCAAIKALIEGDATLSEYIWETYYATDQDKQEIDAFNNSLKIPIYDSAPAFLKDDFFFPYNQGSSFVVDLFNEGSWSAVDAVYKDPPVSTEQILHPNLYPSDKPIPVDLPDLTSALGDGWREVSHNQMGEWDTYEILARGVNVNARLDDTTAQAAAAGWGGDEYAVLTNDATGQSAFVMKSVWDTANDASEFATAFEKYANTRYGVTATHQGNTSTWSYDGGYTTLYLSGDTTIWITTPDASTAQTISGLVQP